MWCALGSNGSDITRRSRSMWIVDFPPGMPMGEAALYEAPFEYVKQVVKPKRDSSRTTISQWWHHERPRVEMREAMSGLDRYIVTPRVSKHRLFVWVSSDALPDSAVIAFARDDDYFFGVLHSRIHELWARSQGTPAPRGRVGVPIHSDVNIRDVSSSSPDSVPEVRYIGRRRSVSTHSEMAG